MTDTIPILRRRRDRREQKQRGAQARLRRVLLGIGFSLSTLLAVLILTGGVFYANLTRNLPSISALPVLLNPPDGILLQPTRFYDRSGQVLLKTLAPTESPRRYIPYDPGNPQHLPEPLVQAVIAACDPAFWEHSGYSVLGVGQPEAHPTVAQKLVSSLLLWDEPPSLNRALRERLLAAQVTSTYGRPQVLEWFLNSADFGNYAYGVDAAAGLYFGKESTGLSLAEASILAAVIQAPSLNPLDAPDAALERGREVLRRMGSLGLISDEEALDALAERPAFAGKSAREDFAPAFLKLVMDQLEDQFTLQRVSRGGLNIYTSLDYDLQQQAACAVRATTQRLTGAPEDTDACQAVRLLPPLPPGVTLPEASASALILDPKTGQVLALVGEMAAGVESASMTAHNAGSLLTPFIYLTGFTRGLSPASLVWDVPGNGGVVNPDGEYHGPLRLRMALANDYLLPAAEVLNQVGLSSVTQTSGSFGLQVQSGSSPGGITDPLSDPVPLTLLDVSAAYAVFATGGVKYGGPSGEDLIPAALLRVESVDHDTWLDWANPGAQPVLTPQLAYLINQVLSDEPARWPSLGHPNAFEIERPVGAKTGWTPDGGDAWAVGYTPYRVVAVWTGTRVEQAGLSPRVPMGLWSALMRYASAGFPPEGWTAPPGITAIDVCDPSGMLPTRDCPAIVREVFASGSEPTQPDNLYRAYEINRETGYLATVFTPPQLVESRVYMAVPPEAREWAAANGLPAPPDSYDAIQPVTLNPNVNISSPTMFADLRGQVEIRGTAAGEDLDTFRLLVGQGLNPADWIQLGGDRNAPVENRLLATWDTSGLNGLYAIQLQVVRADQRVETAVIQVTVDNIEPTVDITYPADGQELSYDSNRQITFQVAASDNLSLARLEFAVDGSSVGVLEDPPYALAWRVRRGEHALFVRAIDRAGNESTARIEFVVE
jgi:membrane peptidoglycan carboxypeptidase